MSVQHHGDGERSDLMERFNALANGESVPRKWTNGRTGADDDGQLEYAIATDDRKRVILIRFPKPTEWVGLDVKSAEELRDQLTERILALKGVIA